MSPAPAQWWCERSHRSSRATIAPLCPIPTISRCGCVLRALDLRPGRRPTWGFCAFTVRQVGCRSARPDGALSPAAGNAMARRSGLRELFCPRGRLCARGDASTPIGEAQPRRASLLGSLGSPVSRPDRHQPGPLEVRLQPSPGDRDPSPRALPVPKAKRASSGDRGRVRDGAMVASLPRSGASERVNRQRHRSAPMPRSYDTYTHWSSVDAL
jgi:hypothetical protein